MKMIRWIMSWTKQSDKTSTEKLVLPVKLEASNDMLREFEQILDYADYYSGFNYEPVLPSRVDDEEIEDGHDRRELAQYNDISGALEALIFMSERPISLKKLQELIDDTLPLSLIAQLVARLQKDYEYSNKGITLREVAGGFQFRSKVEYKDYIHRLLKVQSLVLTPAALEVLALVAYRQPISKTEIDKIRGVDSSHLVRGLLDKRLIKSNGRSEEELGKPVLYGTTSEFLEVFNLSDISQLPPEHELELMAQDNVGKISDIKSICTGDKEQFKFDEFDELDRLSANIKSIVAETPFIKSLRVEEKKRVNEDGAEVRTAFDLLEEYVEKELVTEENKKALEALDPELIRSLRSHILDLPPLPDEAEMDDLEMIDRRDGELRTVTDIMVEQGEELGIDLTFMKTEKNTQVETNLLQ